MNWRRAVLYGFLLWLVPFAVSFLIFGLRQDNRALFESLITVVGVLSAVVAAVSYFRHWRAAGASDGVVVGLLWMAISIVIDLPIFLLVFNMPLTDYMADIALTYLAFPIITWGIAAAGSKG